MRGVNAPPVPQPEEPVVRHRDRPERQFPFAVRTRLDEVIGILAPQVRVSVVQKVRLPEVCERYHAGNQSETPPPEIGGMGPSKQPVRALVGHHRANECQVGTKEHIGYVGPAIGRCENKAA